MNYTLFELERIERILQAKLAEAKEGYEVRLVQTKQNFKAELLQAERPNVSDIKIHGTAVGWEGDGVSGVLSKEWEQFMEEDMELKFWADEVDLFKRGLDALYSYWNQSVEIFIEKMREKVSDDKQP